VGYTDEFGVRPFELVHRRATDERRRFEYPSQSRVDLVGDFRMLSWLGRPGIFMRASSTWGVCGGVLIRR
jgi:hypothetical protein